MATIPVRVGKTFIHSSDFTELPKKFQGLLRSINSAFPGWSPTVPLSQDPAMLKL